MNRKLWLGTLPGVLFLTTMFVSSTFAWFTDFAVNTGNRVQSGNLAVGFASSATIENSNLSGEVQDLKLDSDPVFNLGNAAQPGDSQERYLRIRNEGNIAINYQVDFAVTVDSRLAEVIDFEIQPLGGSTTTVVGTNIDQGIYISLQDNVQGTGGLLRPSSETPQEFEIWRVKMIYTSRADNTYNDETLVFEVDIRLNAWQFNYQDSFNGSNTGGPVSSQKTPYQIYLEQYPDYTGDEVQWLDDLINGRLGEREVYTVTFNSNGGSAVASQQIGEGFKATEPTEPTRLGYTFEGWYYNGYDRWSFAGYTISEDITLIARWRNQAEETHDIFYVLGYENLVQIQTVSYGQMITPLAPSRTGYTFNGWKLADNTPYTGGIFDQRANLVVYASWTARTFNVRLNPGSGTINGSSSVVTRQVVYGSTTSLDVPSSALNNFTGWFNGDQKFTDRFGNVTGTWSILNDIELTALYFITVNSLEEFNAIRDDLGSSYLLNTDLSLTGEWTPIGNANTPFFGQFDGNGHTISNLTVTATQSYVGLFGQVNGTVRNLKLANVNINVNGPIDGPIYAGALAGVSNGTLQQIETLSGNVTAKARAANVGYAGGIVAIHGSSTNNSMLVNRLNVDGIANAYGGVFAFSNQYLILSDSNNYGNINGNHNVGGLIGSITSGYSIERAKNFGNITAESSLGGIFGYSNSGGSLFDSENRGNVNGRGYQVGGLVGYANSSYISNGKNYAPVSNLRNSNDLDYVNKTISTQSETHTGSTGGIVGNLGSWSIIQNSENYADISGMYEVGGIFGQSGGEVLKINLKNDGNIFGQSGLGGIGGYSGGSRSNEQDKNLLNYGEINSFFKQSQTDSRFGGLFGEANGLRLSDSANYGNLNIYGLNNLIGGLIGQSSSGSIINSSNFGNINYLNSNQSYGFSVGGLIGYGSTVSLGYVFNAGNISGTNRVGGLIGEAQGSLFAYYGINFGEVISKTSSIGGIVGSTLPTSNDLEQVYFTNTNLVGEEAVDGIAFGTKLTNLSLINEEFFTAMMEWSTETWSFEGLDIENGVYPVLVFTLPAEEVIG
jgi:uncharacterized repeat protein (TIGR02543 family)